MPFDIVVPMGMSFWQPEVLLELPEYQSNYRISRPVRRNFLLEKCDLNSTCVLCAEGKYYFQTYKLKYSHHLFFSKISNKKNHSASYGPENTVLRDFSGPT